MADLIRFVSSITGSPTVRLNINDETAFWVKKLSAPTPRLRRTIAANTMRDGISVGSSTYDARTLTIEMQSRRSTQDAAATDLQNLWRELDQPTNILQYQPQGATKPVFFRTFRSDTSVIEDVIAQNAMREFTLEILAEPFALGLMETLGPFTVSNDPAAASNPGYVDISGVIGDVAAEAIFWNTSFSRAVTVLGMRHGDFSDIRPSIQAESMALGADTTNPGGGPDAAMSGTGTNNFARTSFATTPGMAVRLGANLYTTGTSQWGSWVMYAAVRRSDATSVFSVGLSNQYATGPNDTATVPLSTSRQLVRLGKYSTVGQENYASRTLGSADFRVWAQRVSGAGTLDWDCIFLVPADAALLEATSYLTTGSGSQDDVFDGIANTTSSTAGLGSPVGLSAEIGPLSSAGRIPQLMPNVTNRLHFLTCSSWDSTGLRVHAKSETNALSVLYWPRYLLVRPVST